MKEFKEYIGTKIIKALPATYKEFCLKKYGEYVESKDPNKIKDKRGYIVKYSDDYMSWSPYEPFEEAYIMTGNLNFGLAVEALRKGKNVSRKEWADGSFIKLIPDEIEKDTSKVIGGEIFLQDNSKWESDIKDILAVDWYIV